MSADVNNVAGGQIADRQGEAVLPFLEAERLLVVGGPDVVGPCGVVLYPDPACVLPEHRIL